MLGDPGDELADQIGLVDEGGVVGLALAPLAAVGELLDRIVEWEGGRRPDGRRAGSAGESVVGEADVARRGHSREAFVVDVARRIGDLQVLVELVLDLFRYDVSLGLGDVAERAAGEVEEVGARNRQRRRGRPRAVVARSDLPTGLRAEGRLREIGEAVVRDALLALIDVIEGGLGALLEVVDHRRRDAPALGPNLVAGRRVDVLPHPLDAPGNVVGLAAGVDHLAVAVAGAQRRRRLDVARPGWQLGDVVDRAAGRPASERERRRTLVDLDAVDREHVAHVPSGIADAVAEQVAARNEAADDRAVALLGAFAGAEGDAGNVLQGLFDGADALLLDDRLRDDVDGLRHVEERHRQPGDAGIADLIGRGAQRRVRTGLPARLARGRRRPRNRRGHRGRGPHRGRRARAVGLHRYGRQPLRLLLARGRRVGRRLRGWSRRRLLR